MIERKKHYLTTAEYSVLTGSKKYVTGRNSDSKKSNKINSDSEDIFTSLSKSKFVQKVDMLVNYLNSYNNKLQ